MIRLQKGMIVFAVLFSAVLLFAGCAAQQPQPEKPMQAPPDCPPEWVLNPPSAEDGIYGVGSAKKNMEALSMQTADMRARDAIVRSIQSKIQTMMKDFMQESGMGENAQSLQFTQSVSKQVSSQELSGCVIKHRKKCSDGTYYSLAVWPINNAEQLKQSLKEKAKNSIKNEEALYNEFKAKQGFEELEKEIDKLDLTAE